MFYDSTMILLIPAMILAFYAQSKVSSAYAKYNSVRNRTGMTGEQAARKILDSNGLSNVPIEMVSGKLTDHYDPRKKVMRLSPGVFQNDSIAAVSIAAHESGHAIQHARHYVPLVVRNSIAPVVSIVSNLAWPLAIIGLVIGTAQGMFLFDLGILFYAGAVFFQVITLPVELNASKRAVAQLQGLGIIYEEETRGAKKMLSAAAMTYLAAMAMAIANLLRLLALRGRN